MTRSNHPLSVAVTNLLNRSLRTPKEIADNLGIGENFVSNWFEGEGLPSDHQMSMILRHFEFTSGSTSNPHMSGVLYQFGDELRRIEKSNKEDFWELQLNEGERVSARLTRFTNNDWMENIVRNIHRVHPSRRRELADAFIKALDRLSDD